MSLEGQVALVTGTKHRLGRNVALSLIQAGAMVALADEDHDSFKYDGETSTVSSIPKCCGVERGQTAFNVQSIASKRIEMKLDITSEKASKQAIETTTIVRSIPECCDVEKEQTAFNLQSVASKRIEMKLDIANEKAVEQAIETTTEQIGPIDILVINTLALDKLVASDGIKSSYLKHDFFENLNSVHNCIGAALPTMLNRKKGRIIGVYSLDTLMEARRHKLQYGIAGIGIVGLIKSLAVEAGRYGVTVNAVCSDLLDADFIQDLYEDGKDNFFEKRKNLHEVAQAVIHLADSYITGAVFPISKGIDLRTL